MNVTICLHSQLADQCLDELAEQKERLLAINRKLKDLDASVDEAQGVRWP